MIEAEQSDIWIVCTHYECGMLKRIFGDRYKLVRVGQQVCGDAHRGVIATEAARTECMSSVSGQEWLDYIVHVRSKPRE